jgi:hypothetical protein
MSDSVYVKGCKVIGCIALDFFGRAAMVGEECIIAGTEELMRTYLRGLGNPDIDKIVIKKIRFNEIMDDMFSGVTYSFDSESYNRFLPIAEMNDVENLPPIDKFLEGLGTGLDFLAIKLT